MPKPIKLINGETALDPTLPPVIKPQLYAVDEYQTCDLIVIRSPVLSSGQKGIEYLAYSNYWDYVFHEDGYRVSGLQSSPGHRAAVWTNTGLSEHVRYSNITAPGHPTVSLKRGWYSYGVSPEYVPFEGNFYRWDGPIWNLKFFDPDDTEAYFKPHPKVIWASENDNTRGDASRFYNFWGSFHNGWGESILIQRFSVWNYPWCEGYSQKVFNTGTKNGTWFALFTGEWTNQIDQYDAGYNPNIPTIAEYNRLDQYVPFFYVSNFIRRMNLASNLQVIVDAEESDTVFVTYLVEEFDFISKQYLQIDLSEGLNNLRYKFDLQSESGYRFIMGNSVVVSSKKGIESHVQQVEQSFENLKHGYLWKTFDDDFSQWKQDYINKVPQTGVDPKNRVRQIFVIPDIDVSQYSSLYFANNNYWNNGTVYEDINPRGVSPIKPLDFPTIEKSDLRYYAEFP
jgi:hypothetical protein